MIGRSEKKHQHCPTISLSFILVKYCNTKGKKNGKRAGNLKLIDALLVRNVFICFRKDYLNINMSKIVFKRLKIGGDTWSTLYHNEFDSSYLLCSVNQILDAS